MTEEDFPPLLKAREVTSRPATRAPAKAQRFTGEIKAPIPPRPVSAITPGTILAITAPSVAPELIPIMPGSASGFLKKS